jgi:hypothetical protein
MAEDTEFARKAQRALEEKEERRIEELKQMEEKMKARAKQGQVSLSLDIAQTLATTETPFLRLFLDIAQTLAITGLCNCSVTALCMLLL